MLSVGKLKEICKHIEKEYGSDCNVTIEFYDKFGERKRLGSDYVLNYGWEDDGTLVLTNNKNYEESVHYV